MNLVKIKVYGEAYYSGKEYSETIFLLEKDYKLLEEDLDGMEIYLGELDGKHSEVFGLIDVTIIPKDKQEEYRFEFENDGDKLYYELKNIDSNIDEMIKRADKYISNIDCLTTISFEVRKSKVEGLEKIINEILNLSK